MNLFQESISEAWQLLTVGDALVWNAAWRSLWISSLAVGLAAILGIPVGAWLARTQKPGTRLAILILRAGMALPTVFVGIVCYGLFARQGPLGSFDILYTPWAIVCGELFLAFPIIATLTHGAIVSLDPRIGETLFTLHVKTFPRMLAYLSEARVGVLLAVLAAFSRCLTELGIAMMVGGNIRGATRTLSTATAMETSRGEFARGLAMGFVLLILAFAATALASLLTTRKGQTK